MMLASLLNNHHSNMNPVYEKNGANLYYCNSEEYNNIPCKDTVSFLFCAKNPFHKEIVGYEKKCEKEHPEYLVAYRPNQHLMALNMVDAPTPEYFSDKMVLAGLEFIDKELAKGREVVVVCNKGESRSTTMCLMYMMKDGAFDFQMTHSQVFMEFSKVAKTWNPRNGILQYCIEYWNKLKKEKLNEKIC